MIRWPLSLAIGIVATLPLRALPSLPDESSGFRIEGGIHILFANWIETESAKPDPFFAADPVRWNRLEQFFVLRIDSDTETATTRFAVHGTVIGDLTRSETNHERRNGISVVPDDNLYAAIRLCSIRFCDLIIGKSSPLPFLDSDRPVLADHFGTHATATGIRIALFDRGIGTLLLTPFYRLPAPGEIDSQSLRQTDRPSLLVSSRDRWDAMLQKSETARNGHGSGLLYHVAIDPFEFLLYSNLNSLNDRQSDPKQSCCGSDRIDYTGVAIAARHRNAPFEIEWFLHLERSRGNVRSVRSDFASRAGKTIDGAAFSTGATLRINRFSGELFVFLPEPHTLPNGSIASANETSGYILSDRSPVHSPLLHDLLDHLPAPTLCFDSETCDGFEISNGIVHYRNHDSLFRIESRYAGDAMNGGISIEWCVPIAPRMEPMKNRFAKPVTDQNRNTYEEATLFLSRSSEGMTVAIHFSFLYQKNSRHGSFQPFGNATQLSLQYLF